MLQASPSESKGSDRWKICPMYSVTIFIDKYQGIHGARGLKVNQYFSGAHGRRFLDVHDIRTGKIYEFKFRSAQIGSGAIQ